MPRSRSSAVVAPAPDGDPARVAPSEDGVVAPVDFSALVPEDLRYRRGQTVATPAARAMIYSRRFHQRCPTCGRLEAAHWYCSQCVRVMGPEQWQTWAEMHPGQALDSRRRLLASGRAFGAGRAGPDPA